MTLDWRQNEGYRGRYRESDVAYQRFKEFLEQGPGRSLLAVATANGVTKQAICGMSTRYNWHKRAQLWDKFQKQREREGKKFKNSPPPLPVHPPSPPPNPDENPFPQRSALVSMSATDRAGEAISADREGLAQEQPQGQAQPEQLEIITSEPVQPGDDQAFTPPPDADSTPPPGQPPSQPPPPPPPPSPGSDPEPEPETEGGGPVEPQVVGSLGSKNKDIAYLKGLEEFRDIYGRLGYAMALESFELFPTIKGLREDLVDIMRTRRRAIAANDTEVVSRLSETINRHIPQYGKLCESMISLANAGRQHWGAVVGIEELLEEAYGPGKTGRKKG